MNNVFFSFLFFILGLGDNTFAIDPAKNQLYYVHNQYVIGVFEGNITHQKVSPMKSNIVLANSRYTNRVSHLWVQNGVLTWSVKSKYSPGLYHGQVGDNDFMANGNISKLKRKSRMMRINNLIQL